MRVLLLLPWTRYTWCETSPTQGVHACITHTHIYHVCTACTFVKLLYYGACVSCVNLYFSLCISAFLSCNCSVQFHHCPRKIYMRVQWSCTTRMVCMRVQWSKRTCFNVCGYLGPCRLKYGYKGPSHIQMSRIKYETMLTTKFVYKF